MYDQAFPRSRTHVETRIWNRNSRAGRGRGLSPGFHNTNHHDPASDETGDSRTQEARREKAGDSRVHGRQVYRYEVDGHQVGDRNKIHNQDGNNRENRRQKKGPRDQG